MPLTQKEFRTDFERYLKVASVRRCDVVVGSELGAAMIGLPFVERGHREALARIRDGQNPKAGILTRLRGSATKLNPGWSTGQTQALVLKALVAHRKQIWEYYDNTFGRLAKKYEVVLVAPSAWLWDPVDGRMRNIACVYDRDGTRVGYQAKVLVSRGERKLARPGTGWQPIETSVGNIGLALGHDALVPEVGRLFASRGASVLVSQLACRTDLEWGRAHRATLMRCMENQLFGAVSCLAGKDRLDPDPEADAPYRGHSMMLAPIELSPKGNGILVQTDHPQRQGMVVCTLDYEALQLIWESSEPAFRQEFSRVWSLYSRSLVPEGDSSRLLPEQVLMDPDGDAIVDSVAEPVEADADPIVVVPPSPVNHKEAAEDSKPASGNATHAADDPDTGAALVHGEELVVESTTLDDLHVMQSRAVPWAPHPTADQPPRQAYDPGDDLEDTREMETLDQKG